MSQQALWRDQLTNHVQQLLLDQRLRIDTTAGRQLVHELPRQLSATPDGLEVVFCEKVFGLIKRPIGLLRLACWDAPSPLALAEAQKRIAAVQGKPGLPMTLIAAAPAFTIEAHELAERRADRTVILAEPNSAGGWNIIGPAEIKPLVDLIDPEPPHSKEARVAAAIESLKADLSAGGVDARRIVAHTRLDAQTAESAMKRWAASQTAIALRRIGGQVVLFDEKSAPPPPPKGT